MAHQELFAKCSFTLSHKVPSQDKELLKKIASLGFLLSCVDPLTIERQASSFADIERLLNVISDSLEPQVGDDFEIIEPTQSLRYEVDKKVFLTFPNENESKQTQPTDLSTNVSMDIIKDVESTELSSQAEGSVEDLAASLQSLQLVSGGSKEASSSKKSDDENTSKANDMTRKNGDVSSLSGSDYDTGEQEVGPELADLRKFASSSNQSTKRNDTVTKMQELKKGRSFSSKVNPVVQKEILSDFQMKMEDLPNIDNGRNKSGTEIMMHAPPETIPEKNTFQHYGATEPLSLPQTEPDFRLPHQNKERRPIVGEQECGVGAKFKITKILPDNTKMELTDLDIAHHDGVTKSLSHNYMGSNEGLETGYDGNQMPNISEGRHDKSQKYKDKSYSAEKKSSHAPNCFPSLPKGANFDSEKSLGLREQKMQFTKSHGFKSGKKKGDIDGQRKKSDFPTENERLCRKMSDSNSNEKRAYSRKASEEDKFYDCHESLEPSIDEDQQSSLISVAAQGEERNMVIGDRGKIKKIVSDQRKDKKTTQETVCPQSREKLSDIFEKQIIDYQGNDGRQYSERSNVDVHGFNLNQSHTKIEISNRAGKDLGRGTTVKPPNKELKNVEGEADTKEKVSDNYDISTMAKGSFDIGKRKEYLPDKAEFPRTGSLPPQTPSMRQHHQDNDMPALQKGDDEVVKDLYEKRLYPDLYKTVKSFELLGPEAKEIDGDKTKLHRSRSSSRGSRYPCTTELTGDVADRYNRQDQEIDHPHREPHARSKMKSDTRIRSSETGSGHHHTTGMTGGSFNAYDDEMETDRIRTSVRGSKHHQTTVMTRGSSNACDWPEQMTAVSQPLHASRDKMEPDKHRNYGIGSINAVTKTKHGDFVDKYSSHEQESYFAHSKHGAIDELHSGNENETGYPQNVEMTDMTRDGTTTAIVSAGAYNRRGRQAALSHQNFILEGETKQLKAEYSSERHRSNREFGTESRRFNEDSSLSSSDSEAEEARGEENRRVLIKPNTLKMNPVATEDKEEKSSSERRHHLQPGHYDNSEEDLRKIPFEVQQDTDYTWLHYIALLPRKMKYPNVEVSMEEIDKGFIIVKGNADEVDQIETSIKKALKEKQVPLVQYSHQRSRDYIQDRTTNPSTASGYSANYTDHYGSANHFKHGRSDSNERREYGSSVDQMRSVLDEFVTDNNKIRVKVIKEDITILNVHAIVNAANGRLRHSGGVAKAIAEKAGPKLQHECSNYTKGESKISVTNLFVSTGGNLRAKHVIHAVGPRWDKYAESKKEECARDLRLTVLHCLLEANRRGLRSIALPSISAAIFKVPKDICTKAYLEAVKTYDIYSHKLRKNTLQEILFVDIMPDMVGKIQERFSSDWAKELDLRQVSEDFDFASKHMPQNRDSSFFSSRENHQGTQSKKQDPLFQSRSPSPKGNHQGTQSKKPDPLFQWRQPSPKGKKEVSERHVYTVGQFKVRVSTEAALKQNADLVVVVGQTFQKLHDSPMFGVRDSLSRKSNLPYRQNSFIFLESTKGRSYPLILNLVENGYSQESINSAFETLREVTGLLGDRPKSVVFTSLALYSKGDLGGGAYPHVDQKLVGAFTRNVYEFLKSFKQASGTSYATIALGADAITTAENVLDSRQNATSKSEERAGLKISSGTQDEECGICLNDNYERHHLTCCKGALCTTCAKKLQKCPFCQKPFFRMKGNMPDGKMMISFTRYSILKGYEGFDTYSIRYEFQAGKQGLDHPCPGKTYLGVTRNAYIPANEEGNRVLQLLRVAFLRRLTFTIGDSLTTGQKNVITWNDIHHKTSLKEGSSYGYPDEHYLQSVTKELADRGVTMETFSEEEKRDLKKIENDLRKSKIFLDFDQPVRKRS